MKYLSRRAAWRYAASAAISLSCCLPGVARAEPALPSLEVRLSDGVIEGMRIRQDQTDLRVFRGIPYAAPPVGDFRWREPQPVARWIGSHEAQEFGPRCMQPAFRKLKFRSKSMSEDCLHLNVWTPASQASDKLPVLVLFHGGNFLDGDASEPRYDGASLAARGIVTVTLNYRLGMFGFLAPPEAARESSHGAAGNYGLLDQVAALRWVRENIAQFGGDPAQVTIGGESSGAIAVAAHMVSPLSRGLFARAIGLNGAALAPEQPLERTQAEDIARKIISDNLLAQLRVKDAQEFLDATGAENDELRLWPSVDGYFLPAMPAASFTAGAQMRVPLLAGTGNQERDLDAMLDEMERTPQSWRFGLKMIFGPQTDEALTYFPGNTEEELMRSAKRLQRYMVAEHSVWRWVDLHRRTGDTPVYYYEYAHPRPPAAQHAGEGGARSLMGSIYGAEIEYALGNLDADPQNAWTGDDREVSRIFSGYVAQFVKTGNPNSDALPKWAAAREERDGLTRQIIAKDTRTVFDGSAAEQAFIQRYYDRFPPSDS